MSAQIYRFITILINRIVLLNKYEFKSFIARRIIIATIIFYFAARIAFKLFSKYNNGFIVRV